MESRGLLNAGPMLQALDNNGDYSSNPEKEVTNDLIPGIRDMSKPIKFSFYFAKNCD